MSTQFVHVWSFPDEWSSQKVVPLPQEKLQQISIGEKHAIALTESKILGIGKNTFGQLGTEEYDDDSQQADFKCFIEIKLKISRNKVKQVSCGWNFTLLLDVDGNVFSAGESVGLGQGKNTSHSYSFKKVGGGLKNINFISAGKDHSLALSSTKVYGWGSNTAGQLGMIHQKIFDQPIELHVLYSYNCFAGNQYSFFATQKGVYTAGRNTNGRLGLQAGKRNRLPCLVSSLPLQRVAKFSGCSRYSLVEMDGGESYMAGQGSFGSFTLFTKIKHFSKCQYVLMGEQFGILCDKNGNIQSWKFNKDSSPLDNREFSVRQPYLLAIGPTMSIFQPTHHYSNSNTNTNTRVSIKYPNYKQSGQQNMEKSLAQWSQSYKPSYQVDSSIPNSVDFRQSDRMRKQSVGLNYANNFNVAEEEHSKYYDNFPHTQEYDQDQGFLSSNRQEMNSPHFRKEGINSMSRKLSNSDLQASNRISGFDGFQFEDRISQRSRNQQNLSKQYKVPIETIEEQNGTNNNLTTKTLIRSSGKNTPEEVLIEQYQNESEISQKIKYLERENVKKDEMIRKMRKQFIELVQIVQSQMCLKNIVERKGKNHLLNQPQMRELVAQQRDQDQFGVTIEQLRGVLERSLESFTYSS